MEDHNTSQLWTASTDRSVPLRRPYSNNSPSAVLSNGPSNLVNNARENSSPNQQVRFSPTATNELNSTPATIDVSRSNLSVDAEEWFPPNYPRSQTSPVSVSNRLTKIRNSSQNNLPSPQVTANTDNMLPSPQTDLPIPVQRDISRLQSILSTLTYEPGQFHNLLDIFMETFKPYFEDVIITGIMSNMLFKQVCV